MGYSSRFQIWRKTVSSSKACFFALALFIAIVFLTGGGSRDDIQSLVILRPLSVLFAAYALSAADFANWKGRLFPLYILMSLMLLMILQLIPLPPEIWTSLPQRRIFAEIADLAGMEQPWRPLTLSPSKTLNSLFSLFVPLAAILLYLNLSAEWRKRALLVIVTFISLSAFLAVLQIIGPARGPLYFYRITNHGSGVGFFANRNHQAVLLAILILLFGWYAGVSRRAKKRNDLKLVAPIAGIMILLPLVFVMGSRAGLILTSIATPIAFWLAYATENIGRKINKKVKGQTVRQIYMTRENTILLLSVITATVVISASLLASRSLSFDRLFAEGDIAELRTELLPVLFAMARDYMPFGIGFGAFEHVYEIHEPLELLRPAYLNQAHNDWLQFVIEAGAPGLVIIAIGGLWVANNIWIITRSWKLGLSDTYTAVTMLAGLVFICAASIGDYPLRVPTVMIVGAIFLAVFSDTCRNLRFHVKQ